MNKKHFLALAATLLVSLALSSACGKKDKEPTPTPPPTPEAPTPSALPPHIQARVVKDLYLPETKTLETKKDDIFLAMKELGWKNGSFPAFEDPDQEKSWTFALKDGVNRKDHPLEYAVYSRVSPGDNVPQKVMIFAKSFKLDEYSDALLAEKGGLLEYYGFTDNYFLRERKEGASEWGAMAKNSQLNLGAVVIVASGVSHIVDGVEIEEPAIRLAMVVADWEDLEGLFPKRGLSASAKFPAYAKMMMPYLR